MPRYGQRYMMNGQPFFLDGGAKFSAPCAVCSGMSQYLCDWPMGGRTCSKPLCEEHRHVVGKRDYCPEHFKL